MSALFHDDIDAGSRSWAKAAFDSIAAHGRYESEVQNTAISLDGDRVEMPELSI